MKVALCGDLAAADWPLWRQALAAAMPEAQWLDREAALAAADEVQAAVVANPPPGSLQGLPRLRLVQSLWAGVDRLLADATLPADVPLARMVDPAMSAAMAETALWAVLSLHRGFFTYAQRQARAEWRAHAQRRADEIGVLVLGQGEMGRACAARLAQQGYRVRAWRRDGTPLAPLLARSAVVVNLLPLTPDTRGLIDARFLAALPAGAGIVNLARGAHVVDADLLAALGTGDQGEVDYSGHIGHVVLDVFNTEPLPPAHPFWRHPQVTLLPHAAAWTDPRSAAAVAVANLRALRDGGALANLVNRQRGY